MRPISIKLSDELTITLDEASTKLQQTRSDVIRQAIEYYLDDFEDASRAIEILRDLADSILHWEAVKDDLLYQQ